MILLILALIFVVVGYIQVYFKGYNLNYAGKGSIFDLASMSRMLDIRTQELERCRATGK